MNTTKFVICAADLAMLNDINGCTRNKYFKHTKGELWALNDDYMRQCVKHCQQQLQGHSALIAA
jgi:hypothetical protein